MKKNIIIFYTSFLVALTLTALLVRYLWCLDLIVPIPPPYSACEGFKYANLLANSTQRLSFFLVIAGWISVILGGLLAVAGAVLGSRPLGKEEYSLTAVIKSQRGLICAAFAIVFCGLGWQCIDRSTSATKTASIATTAIAAATNGKDSDNDKKAYDACVKAKAAWLEGRMTHDRLQNIVNSLSTPSGVNKKAGMVHP